MKIRSVAIVAFLSCTANFTCAHDLVLNVDSIKKIKGNLIVSLFNSETTYQSNSQSVAHKKIPVKDDHLVIKFGDVPDGHYAIRLFQDENENETIDTNLLGMPTEGYGFSNNGGVMGEPSFEAAKFNVNSPTVVTIHLR